MRERGFLDTDLKVKDLIQAKQDKQFFSVNSDQTVKEVLSVMKKNDISQLPVMENGEIIGSVSESALLEFILNNPLTNTDKNVSEILEEGFPMVDMEMNAKEINRYMSKDTKAVISKDQTGTLHILTQYDILQAL
jgi:cystathionine beta-synthase